MSAYFETYLSTGLKQDVVDALEVISPKDTPVYDMLRKGKATATIHEWLEIPLPTATAVGDDTVAEGFTYTFASGGAFQPVETRRANYTQIFQRPWRVSGTVEAVQKYGRDSEWNLRKTHALMGWKVDVETVLLDNSASAAGSSGVKRQMNGLRYQDSLSATAATSGSAPIDESNLNSLLQLMWDQGVNPDTLICGSFVKRQLSLLAGNGAGRPIVIENGQKKLTSVVDFYESDYGDLAIVPSRRLSIKSEVIAMQKNLMGLAMLRPPFTEVTPKTGDFLSGIVIGELTFEYLNANGGGRLRRVQSASGA